MPKNKPTASETPKDITIEPKLTVVTHWVKFPIIFAPIVPKIIPSIPPKQLSTDDSTMNWKRISFGRAPIAFRRPISRVLSVTETSMFNPDIPIVIGIITPSIRIIFGKFLGFDKI
jgi:hypothetical protein